MSVFINIGDAPLSARQATKRGMQIVEQELFLAGARPGDRDILAAVPHAALPQRLSDVVTALGHASYADYATAWETDNVTNGANNLTNYQLAAYASASARLARYRLAEGQAEVVYEAATGEIDPDTGAPITAPAVLQPAIDPLPIEIEQPLFDEQTGEATGTQMVLNPAIAEDDAERAAASAVIAAAPPAVLAALSTLETLPGGQIAIPQPPAGAGWVWSGARWVIDLNTASAAVLQTLAGVGSTLANTIIAGRPLRTPSQLVSLSGISSGMVEAWVTDPGLIALQTNT